MGDGRCYWVAGNEDCPGDDSSEYREIVEELAAFDPVGVRFSCVFCGVASINLDEHTPECLYRRAVELAGTK